MVKLLDPIAPIKEEFTITFETYGGEGTVNPMKVKAGDSIKLPSGSGLSMKGYKFNGWSLNGSDNYPAGSKYTPYYSTTFYAVWIEDNFSTTDNEIIAEIAANMIYVPGGSFQMGSNSGYNNEQPVHTVTLSGFSMGKYEVTQEQWTAVMGSNPSFFTSSPATGEVQGKRPVEQVSWYDALVFCNKLSMREGLSPAYSISGSTDPEKWGSVPTSANNTTWDAVVIVAGSTGYRLPTEAQWEYAARGGNGSPGNYTYSGSNNVDDVAWYSDNSGYMTHEVGKKAPNGLGLYDMSGNVWEWCGTGMGVIQAERRPIPWARTLGLLVCYAAGVGAVRRRALVLPIGAATTRTTGAAASASGWCAPEFCAKKPTVF